MRVHGPTKCTCVWEKPPSAGDSSTQQASALRCKLVQGGTGHRALHARQRHAKAAVTDLQCSSIRLSEAPEVASSTGEVSPHRCMHWGGNSSSGPVSAHGKGPWQVCCGMLAGKRCDAVCMSSTHALHQAKPYHLGSTRSAPWSC